MSQISCVYLGWKQPAVRASADFLFDRYEQNGLVDLTQVIIVTPTRRAGRRLREVILEVAESKQLGFFPPQITTVGQLPELLYERKLPFAPPLVQQFAWVDALKKTDRKTLERIVPRYPESDSDPRWMELGAMLQRQHLELTDHRLDFATVAKRGSELQGFTDFARWQALAKVQERYLKSLDNLELWDRQTARNYAIDHDECNLNGEIVLIGTVDLSRTLRGMLDQVADRVTTLVYAERSMSNRFDQYGCVEPSEWQTTNLGVEDRHILVADGPANQADAVVYAIEQFEGKYGADNITIGIPDPSLVPHVENKLQQFQIETRWGPGRSLAASPPAQWLRIVADYLATERYEPFAELLRHSDTAEYLMGLGQTRDAVKEFDKYFDKHLPDHIRDDKSNAGELPETAFFLFDLLKGLRTKEKPPKAWAEEIFDVLVRLYDRRQLHIDNEHDRATLDACDRIQQTIERFSLLPEELTPSVSASAAILMVLSQIADEEVPPSNASGAIEMVGWLDLPLDDAKVAIVTNMNDGVVPRSVSSDVFLPNRFREALGLDDNARRYARDAYALQTLLNSRMVVRLITGRRAATNDPLRPSRLLLATPNEKLADRCLRLFNGKADCTPIVMAVSQDELLFKVPKPEPLAEPITSMSVTNFADYLRCPYRFYLKKVMRIRTMDDKLTELDGSKFGTLAHAVLEDFGLSELKDSDDVDEIGLYLAERLVTLAKEEFGEQPKPAVQVQLAQLRLRLDAFAVKQAEWRSNGWKIIQTEFEEERGEMNVDGEPFFLKGRIDRIDHRVVDGKHQYAVLDYKAGDAGDAPDKKHIKGKDYPVQPEQWVDLQLPLYRYLLRSVEGLPEELNDTNVRLGYVLLPSVPSNTRFAMATWNDDTLLSADRAANNVVRRIREEEFWPPTDPFPFKSFDDHSAIVQHGVFGREEFLEVTGA